MPGKPPESTNYISYLHTCWQFLSPDLAWRSSIWAPADPLSFGNWQSPDAAAWLGASIVSQPHVDLVNMDASESMLGWPSTISTPALKCILLLASIQIWPHTDVIYDNYRFGRCHIQMWDTTSTDVVYDQYIPNICQRIDLDYALPHVWWYLRIWKADLTWEIISYHHAISVFFT